MGQACARYTVIFSPFSEGGIEDGELLILCAARNETEIQNLRCRCVFLYAASLHGYKPKPGGCMLFVSPLRSHRPSPREFYRAPRCSFILHSFVPVVSTEFY